MSIEDIVYVDFHKKEVLTSLEDRAKYLARRWSLLRSNHADQKQAEYGPHSTESFMGATNNFIGLTFKQRYSDISEEEEKAYAVRLEGYLSKLSHEQQELARLTAGYYVKIQDPSYVEPGVVDLPNNVIPFPLSRVS